MLGGSLTAGQQTDNLTAPSEPGDQTLWKTVSIADQAWLQSSVDLPLSYLKEFGSLELGVKKVIQKVYFPQSR